MQIIPLAAVASQTLKVVLAQQNCVLNVYQKSTGMYLDVSLEGEAILAGVLCRDRVRCVRQAYLGFVGDLAFMDTEGTDDPVYSGLGTRWVLMYLSPEDLVEKATQASIDFQSRINAANAWAAAHPLVLTGALANGIQGVPYSSSITLQGQMANSALSWSVVGSLPAGLSLDSRSGVVSGTPTAGLTIVSFTLRVKDNLGRTATSAQTVKIGQTFTMAIQLPGIMSLTRPSIGTYFDPTAVLQVAANDQPRFDYDPVTLALRGLLVEEQRTNAISNSSATGAAVGTLPTGWSLSLQSGVTGSVVAVGAESGLSYVDIRFQGTIAGAGLELTVLPAASVAASPGQGWACSWFVKLVGGSLTGVSETRTRVIARTSGSAYISSDNTPFTMPTSPTQLSACRSGSKYTLPANSALVQAAITAVCAAGSIDFTLRVALPQLELGSSITSPVPTAGSQVTRAADVATITVPSGFTTLTYGFDDGTSAQEIVSAGPHTIPTPVAPRRIEIISVTA